MQFFRDNSNTILRLNLLATSYDHYDLLQGTRTNPYFNRYLYRMKKTKLVRDSWDCVEGFMPPLMLTTLLIPTSGIS